MITENASQWLDSNTAGFKEVIIICICLIFNMIDGFDITAMAIAVNSVGTEMQIAADKLGLIFSVALAGMMLGAMFLAPISDIIGRRRMIIIALSIVGVTVLATGFVNQFELLIILRFCSGLGAGALLASQTALASEYSTKKYRALAVTTVIAGYPMGAMLTGIVAHWIMPEYGWRGLFIAGGTTTLIMVVVAYLCIPESLQFLMRCQPAGALNKIHVIQRRLGRELLAQLPEKTAVVNERLVVANIRALLQPLYRFKTLTLWLVFFLCFSTLYFLMSWIPKLMLMSGFNNTTAFKAFTVFNFGGVIGIFSLGLLSTRIPLNYLVSGFLLVSALAMLLFSQLPTQENLLLILLFLIGIMQQGGFTGLYAVAAEIYTTDIRSTGVGWAIGLGRLGAVVGPAVAGYTIASGLSAANNMIVFAMPMILGGITAFSLKERQLLST